ncbi:MAG: sugar phosphate isomerase/epimerase, partial [Clostridiales bacterium]|nr:sugar phosphate isomerase/epimerase [Clostridiales bacterium]
MHVGVVSRSFPGFDNRQVAEYMAKHGYLETELCLTATDSDFWRYNGTSDLTELTDERFAEICDVYRSRGIKLVALGVFTNLIEPDDEKRAANLAYFCRHIELAGKNGIPFVSTECGFDPDHRGVRTTCYESAIERLKDSLTQLLAECDQWNVDIALETCVIDVVPSAKRARDIILQVGHPRLRVLLDPANLIANSDEDDMFKYLSPFIAYFHGKDRKVNDTYGRVVGDGDIDWPRFMALYHRHNEGAPFILEYVKPENMDLVRNRVLT